MSRATGVGVGGTGGCAQVGDASGSQSWAPSPILGADHRDSQESGPSAPQRSSGRLVGGGGTERLPTLRIPAVETGRWDRWRFRVEEKRGGGEDEEQPVGAEAGVGGGAREGRGFERRGQEWCQVLARGLLDRNWDGPCTPVTPTLRTLGRWFQRLKGGILCIDSLSNKFCF